MFAAHKPWPYLLAILLLNLFQSAFAELAHDEAYYWVYSQHLDWGYFDHPPAVAVLINFGYTLLENELGVRLFVVLANVATIWLLFQLVRPAGQQVGLFFLMLFSCAIVHVGFLAVPDIPLLLTVALFFYFYRQYLNGYDWKYAVLLGAIVAAMGYSKYHGIVVLVSVLLSNWRLLQQKSFYGLLAVATALYLPHLYWQYAHDFPTFRFQLFDRSTEPYRLAFVGEYVLGQLAVFGPLIGFVLFWAAYRFSPKNNFERGLQYAFYGIFGFFLVSSFKGRVEPNWTAMGLVPLAYMAWHFLAEKPGWVKWIPRLGWPSLVLIAIFRLVFVVNFIPSKIFPLSREFHGWDQWAADLEAVADGRPALFFNSYQRAAKYSFYSQDGFALNTVGYAGSQYDLMTARQEALQGQPVALVHNIPRSQPGTDLAGKDHVYVELLDSLYFYNRLTIRVAEPPDEMAAEESTIVAVELCNPTNATIQLRGNKGTRPAIGYVVFHYKKWIQQSKKRTALPVTSLEAGGCASVKLPLVAPPEPGKYRYRMSLFNGIYDERNDRFHPLEVN